MPNPSEAAIADSWHGPYTVLGNPHPDDETHTSFHSQISSVFKVPGKKDLYIACADRWMPNAMDIPYSDVEAAYDGCFDPDVTAEQRAAAQELMRSFPPAKTKEADYVWLPLHFDGDKVVIKWYDEWRVEDFE